MNRFELTPENFNRAHPVISEEEATRLASIPRRKFYFSVDDLEIMQAAFSTYLELSDPDSEEYKKIEYLGLNFEEAKDYLKDK